MSRSRKVTSLKVDDFTDGRAGYEVKFAATRNLTASFYYATVRDHEVLEVLTWQLNRPCSNKRVIAAIQKHFAPQ